jgi:polyhydroxyalkanoate synthesis regulator phasin
MDDAWPLLEFLPASFKEPGEQEYIEFLWNAFVSNYESGNYQFAMLPLHMLYMSFVYFSVWQIKLMRQKDFENATIFVSQKERDILTATSPFTFSVVNERSVFKFLKLIGCSDQHTGPFVKLVDKRNELAHSNGLIACRDQNSANHRITELMQQVSTIQTHMTPVLHECVRSFLIDSCPEDGEMQYDNATDQVRELLVHKNYFSLKDIEACRSFDIESLNNDASFPAMRALFGEFLMLYPQDEGAV